MSGGESDAVKYVPVSNYVPFTPTIEPYPYTGNTTTSNILYNYTSTIYKYQIKCPGRGCKTFNWLEIDKISPCVKCGLKLKAVSEQADFEIEVTP